MDVQIINDHNIDIIFDRSFSHELETLTFPIIPKHKFVMGRENKNSYMAALAKEGYTLLELDLMNLKAMKI